MVNASFLEIGGRLQGGSVMAGGPAFGPACRLDGELRASSPGQRGPVHAA